MEFLLLLVFVLVPGTSTNYLRFNNMKKYLFILSTVFSITSFSDVTYEEAVIENLQDVGSNISDIQFQLSNFFSPDPDSGYEISLKELLYWSLYDLDLPAIPTILGDISNFTSEAWMLQSEFFPYIIETLNNNSPTDILFYLQDGQVSDNINAIAKNTENLEISVTQLGDRFDQIISSGNDEIDLLGAIIDELQMLNGSAGSSSELPKEQVGFYDLKEYGKDVNVKNLQQTSFTTTGEYNRDVHMMLMNLNRLGSSQNNAALSILTNVQVIATILSEDAEGKEKVEKDIEDKEYESTKAESQESIITSQSWDSYFTPPRSVSDVYGNLTIDLFDPGLPTRINVIDRFYYETTYYNFEFDEIHFQIPQPLIEIASYGRIVFGFIYWSLTFFIAIFIFRLWVKIYIYVSQSFMNK